MKATVPTRPLVVRLVLTSLPALPGDEQADLGWQDAAGAIHPGQSRRGGGLTFECEVQAVFKGEGIDFRGACVHGRPGERFIYLSWKRPFETPTPWVQRVKVPLAGLAPLCADSTRVEADITGRRPHDTRPIEWLAVA